MFFKKNKGISVLFKKLSPFGLEPTHGSKDAAGYDLKSAIEKPIQIKPEETVVIPTDLAIVIPKGYFGAVFPRSGLSTKKGLRLANCVGVIDSDYRGNIQVPLYNDSNKSQIVEPAERIAQLVLIPYQPIRKFIEVNDLGETERGSNGFGSTGNK